MCREIFEIEDILDKTKTECYKDRKKYAFLHGVDMWSGTRNHRKVFATLLDDTDHEIVEQDKFYGIKACLSEGYATIFYERIKQWDGEKNLMKDCVDNADHEDYPETFDE